MIRNAKLISHSTKDGWDVMKDDIPIGKEYKVDDSTITEMLHGIESETGLKMKQRECIMILNKNDEADGYMPLELLELI